MKKIFLLTLICVLSLSFVACEKKEEAEVISADDIEQNEDFQKVLLQTSMVKSEPMTMEERVDFMLSLYRKTFENSIDLIKDSKTIRDYCFGAVHLAFDDASELVDETKISKLEKILEEPLGKAIDWKHGLPDKTEFDFDTLIPQLKEKALQILK